MTIFSPNRCRQGRHAEVDGPVAELELHAAVLGHTLLSDVQAADDLDARRELVLDGDRRLGDLAQLPVDPESDAVVVLVRLEVKIGGTRRLIASISIFCRNRTTGASSTSVVTSGDSCSVASSVTSKSKSSSSDTLDRLRWRKCPCESSLRQLVVLDDHPLRRELCGELDPLRPLPGPSDPRRR
jgi:hypothetical protein